MLAGFFTIFPTLYIPVVNHDVFKHRVIGWSGGSCFWMWWRFLRGVRLGMGEQGFFPKEGKEVG